MLLIFPKFEKWTTSEWVLRFLVSSTLIFLSTIFWNLLLLYFKLFCLIYCPISSFLGSLPSFSSYDLFIKSKFPQASVLSPLLLYSMLQRLICSSIVSTSILIEEPLIERVFSKICIFLYGNYFKIILNKQCGVRGVCDIFGLFW